MKEFNYISNLDEVTEFDKEYEKDYYGYNVTVKEDKENYYLDFNVGDGIGVYAKEDWSLDAALYDQTHCGDDSYYNINTLDELADCCDEHGSTAVKEDIERAVDRNGWGWMKNDENENIISDGIRKLIINDEGDNYFDDIDKEILKEKLDCGEKICFIGRTYTVYEDEYTYYIDDEDMEEVYTFPKTYGKYNALITLRTWGDVKKINFDSFKNINDIRNSNVMYSLDLNEIKAFLEEVSKRTTISFEYKKEKDKYGHKYYLLSDAEGQQLRIYEYGYKDEESYDEYQARINGDYLDYDENVLDDYGTY